MSTAKLNLATQIGDADPIGTVGQQPAREDALEAVRTLIAYTGEDITREGLLSTPDRVVRSYDEFFGGYTQDPNAILERTFTETD